MSLEIRFVIVDRWGQPPALFGRRQLEIWSLASAQDVIRSLAREHRDPMTELRFKRSLVAKFGA